jgi:geranylgeranyl diphosphate synthase type II
MATGICEGQQLDVDFEHASQVSIEDYMHMIELKTSVLLAYAMRIGGYIAGANEAQQEALYQYGLHIGLAFQIQDDILDVIGDSKELGKQVGSDEKDGKTTYVTLHGLEQASKDVRSLTDSALVEFDALSVQDDFLRSLIVQLVSRRK